MEHISFGGGRCAIFFINKQTRVMIHWLEVIKTFIIKIKIIELSWTILGGENKLFHCLFPEIIFLQLLNLCLNWMSLFCCVFLGGRRHTVGYEMDLYMVQQSGVSPGRVQELDKMLTINSKSGAFKVRDLIAVPSLWLLECSWC